MVRFVSIMIVGCILLILITTGCTRSHSSSGKLRGAEMDQEDLDSLLGKSEKQVRQLLGEPDEDGAFEYAAPYPDKELTKEQWEEWRNSTAATVLIYDDVEITLSVADKVIAAKRLAAGRGKGGKVQDGSDVAEDSPDASMVTPRDSNKDFSLPLARHSVLVLVRLPPKRNRQNMASQARKLRISH